jgi:hypothetical protein
MFSCKSKREILVSSSHPLKPVHGLVLNRSDQTTVCVRVETVEPATADEDGGAMATSAPATKAVLHVLARPTSHGRNWIKPAETEHRH